MLGSTAIPSPPPSSLPASTTSNTAAATADTTTTTPTVPTATTAAATTTTTTTATPVSPSSPTRPSRLRGFSYLRNHLHRSDPPPPLLVRSTSSPIESVGSVARTTPSAHHQHEQPSPLSPAATATATGPHAPRGTSGEQIAPTASTIQSGEKGWIPTAAGRTTALTTTVSATPQPNCGRSCCTTTADSMTHSRAATAFGPTASNTSVRRTSTAADLANLAAMPSAVPAVPALPATTMSSAATPAASSKDPLPTIRFIPHVENRSSRPSLHFTALSRQLKQPDAKVRVGRFSERDSQTSDVVGFKSKVVSRRHCEFWCTDGQWYVKDVKSSSGTFLNHVRLSSPGVESRPYPVNDGDVVQLGIDFKGGEEVIFRCVKIRIECNRGWQKSLNNFNTSAHKRLFPSSKSTPKAKVRDSDTASVNSSECSICLNPVAPCQALFVAPCSHVWHYKCIRGLIHGPNYPNFLCPNCRFVADLEADVEQPEEEAFEDFEAFEDQADAGGEAQADRVNGTQSRNHSDDSDSQDAFESPPDTGNSTHMPEIDRDLSRMLNNASLSSPTPQVCARADRSNSSALPVPTSQPINIARTGSDQRNVNRLNGARSTTPTSHAQFALSVGPPAITDGPMTPRNDVGPFVLDGSAGRDRIVNNLVTQAVSEVAEPTSPEEVSARNWPL